MSKLPRIPGSEAKRAFERAGFAEDRMRGSHCILKRDGHEYHLTIPLHKGKTLGPGLLKSLIQASGLSVDEFTSLL